MCEYGTLEKIHVIYDLNPPRENDILVDSCIADEIEKLNNYGVKTLGCCCGHGEYNPECLIDMSSISICKKLGYDVHEYSDEHTEQGIYEIYLKSKFIYT